MFDTCNARHLLSPTVARLELPISRGFVFSSNFSTNRMSSGTRLPTMRIRGTPLTLRQHNFDKSITQTLAKYNALGTGKFYLLNYLAISHLVQLPVLGSVGISSCRFTTYNGNRARVDRVDTQRKGARVVTTPAGRQSSPVPYVL